MECPCGAEITRQPHDSNKDWAWKVDNQRCRRKCARLFPVTKERPHASLPSSVAYVEGKTRAVGDKPQPWRSEEYKAWIRTFPCLNPHCRSTVDVESHHEQRKGHGGKGTVTDDDRCVPLCTRCHVPIRHTYGRGIWRQWGLDIEAVVLRFNEEWMSMGKAMKGGDG